MDGPPPGEPEPEGVAAAKGSVAPPAPSALERIRLVDVIRKLIRTNREQQDRRATVRHEAVDREVWAGWWDGDDFGVVSGRIMNLSRGGAKAVLGARPPSREPIWLYKETGDTLATVRAYVVSTGVAPGGMYTVRFRFVGLCPTIFAQAALCEQPPRKNRGRLKIVPPRGVSGSGH